ncbi:MAG: helix-hairpin-helix domain-containing protein [Coriobacteriia bacterium]|nr:helix-hairpin-helix domain-containing protein [Coriobacteriia bacterium]
MMFAHQQNRKSKRSQASASKDNLHIPALPKKGVYFMVVLLVAAIYLAWSYINNNSNIVKLDTNATSHNSLEDNDTDTSQDALPNNGLTVQEAATPDMSSASTGLSVYVHISGAVNKAGVVCLPIGSRLIDGVDCCGGLSDDAAPDYINLAALLIDGTHLYIPSQSDIEALRSQGLVPEQQLMNGFDWNDTSSQANQSLNGASEQGHTSIPNDSGQASVFPIDINSADQTALQTVPGIGPVTAQRIIDYRTQHGRFNSLEDLLLISGIGEKRLADFRPYLTCK